MSCAAVLCLFTVCRVYGRLQSPKIVEFTVTVTWTHVLVKQLIRF